MRGEKIYKNSSVLVHFHKHWHVRHVYNINQRVSDSSCANRQHFREYFNTAYFYLKAIFVADRRDSIAMHTLHSLW